MTAVLRHVRKYRPDWVVDYVADRGRHSAAFGLVRHAFYYGKDENELLSNDGSRPEKEYDREILISLYDTFAAWTDRPNTRVTSCLHEKFGMEWDRSLASYEVNVRRPNATLAHEFLDKIVEYDCLKETFPIVCVHYEGDSSATKKNLTHEQANDICDAIIANDRVPLLLDWRKSSRIGKSRVASVAALKERDEWGRDAQINTAIIQQCEAFVGIDSGPGKCATASGTPTLICWTGHHPALYHDLSPTTTHLVPSDHASIHPVNGNEDVLKFFLENYNVRYYDTSDNQGWQSYTMPTGRTARRCNDLVGEVKHWLKEVLK